MSRAVRRTPTSHQAKRAELRRRSEAIKARRDARDAEIGARLRREQAGQPTMTIEELRRRLKLDT